MRAARIEGERLDVVDDGFGATREVKDAGLPVNRLLVAAQFVFLRFRQADGVCGPLRIGGEDRLRAKRHCRCRSVRHLRYAQLVVAVRPVDAVGNPPAVRRQAAVPGDGLERFELAVFRGAGMGLLWAFRLPRTPNASHGREDWKAL